MDKNFTYYKRDDNAVVDFYVRIPGGLYPITTCVVDLERFKAGGRVFPCGSGDDHRLTNEEMKAVRNLFEEKGDL